MPAVFPKCFNYLTGGKNARVAIFTYAYCRNSQILSLNSGKGQELVNHGTTTSNGNGGNRLMNPYASTISHE
jgi:hypothetical protein